MYTFFSSLGNSITNIDVRILTWIHYNLSNPFMDKFMPIVTKLGDAGIVWIVLALVLLVPKKTRKTGAAMAVAMILGLIFGNGIIKNLVARPRPFDISYHVLSRKELLIPAPGEYSFPSGHTLASFEAATVIYRDHSLLGFFAFLLAGLIAFSRLYLCVHYPSDVLGGMILGVLFGLLGCKIVRGCTDMHKKSLQKRAEAAAENK